MEQQLLIAEDIYEALQGTVMACGGYKKVGSLLWPHKPADEAGRLLANSCNRGRQEKLDPEQFEFVARLGRENGCHISAVQFCRDTGYGDPNPVEPDDERAKLQREFVQSVEVQKQILTRLEKLK